MKANQTVRQTYNKGMNMKDLNTKNRSSMGAARNGLVAAVGLLSGLCSSLSFAQQTNVAYSAEPAIFRVVSETPKVMLTMSLDHQLFMKAYNDYDDLIGSNLPETTYTHEFDYIGYFDNAKCYVYKNSVFTADGQEEDAVYDGQEDANGYCTDNVNSWSGNFLNWLSMTRIDIVRYVLFGGHRSVDTNNKTVLERTYLPTDAHSYAKYYKGEDILGLVGDTDLPSACSADDSEPCGYTFCNTSKPPTTRMRSQEVDTATSPPLIRIIKGDYSLWASAERFQCLARSEFSGEDKYGLNGNDVTITNIPAASDAPRTAAGIKDLIVRVEICAGATDELASSHKCKEYGDVRKPVGILHDYGIEKGVDFGLMSGSYVSNKDYGALRANVGDFSLEVDEKTGIFNDVNDSIVGNINAFRLVDYRDGTYNRGQEDDPGYCNFQLGGIENGECRNWGNPFSEILAESYRYFSKAKTPLGGAAEEDNGNFMAGLTVATWPDPDTAAGADIHDSFACANLNVLGFNSSSVSYDSDQFYDGFNKDTLTGSSKTISDLGIPISAGGENPTIDSLTDFIGEEELAIPVGGLINDEYFVGNVVDGVSNDECSSKEIADHALSKVRGTCSEAPRLEGSYLGAGLAHYFHTQADIKISTYGVKLNGAQPKIEVEGVTIIPACLMVLDSGVISRCSLVAFQPIGEVTATSGSYLINWEDTEQGGDYDSDLVGVISYTVETVEVDGLDVNKLHVDTKLTYESAPNAMQFGFIISGVGFTGLINNDGAYYPSITESDEVDRIDGIHSESTASDECTASDLCTAALIENPEATNPVANQRIQRMSFTLAPNVAKSNFLKGPLYYASKWGSFVDAPSVTDEAPDEIPNGVLGGEWQTLDKVTNKYSPNGYSEVKDPGELGRKMDAVFARILDRPAVSTGASASFSSPSGVGLMLQTNYSTKMVTGGKTVTWVGSLNGLLRDKFGNLRESSGLSIEKDDLAIEYVTKDDESDVSVQRSTVADDGTLTPIDDGGDSIDSVKALWSAHSELAFGNGIAAAYTSQRVYSNSSDSADGGRYIFTGVAGDDGQVGFNEVVDFNDKSVEAIGGLLDFSITEIADSTSPNPGAATVVPAPEANTRLINYIRGLETEGMRSRTIRGKPWLLGDIIHATPLIVSKPSAFYHKSLGNDASYKVFVDRYAYRRQVVYAGANDGMLHAFNAGFLSPWGVGYTRQPYLPESGPNGALDQGVTNHPLGGELWAYVPYNLLPHLKWLADEDYQHVYFMDGDIQQFDVNIFKPSTRNPGGWGTIIVAGMRLGGGSYTLPGTDGPTLSSAYVIMDVTDPEEKPRLLAEVTAEDLGFTVSNTQVVVNRSPVNVNFTLSEAEILDSISTPPAKNDWHLLMGSGPSDLGSAEGGSGKLFTLNLSGLDEGNSAPVLSEHSMPTTGLTPEFTGGFVGGVTVIDWNRDYSDDAVYFGLVENSVDANGDPVLGRLMNAGIRFTESGLSFTQPRMLLDGPGSTDYSFSTEPFAIPDRDGNRWVYAGTGRFMVGADNDNDEQNTYVGIVVNEESTSAVTTGAAATAATAGASTAIAGTVGTSVSINDLVDVASLDLLVDPADKANHAIVSRDAGVDLSNLIDPDSSGGVVTLATFNPWVVESGGWIRDFSIDGDTSKAELVSGRTGFVNDSLLVNAYDPLAAQGCGFPGVTTRYIFDMFNGLPQIGLVNLNFADGTSLLDSENQNTSNVDGWSAGDVGNLKSTTSVVGEMDGYSPDNVVSGEDGTSISDGGAVTTDSVALDPTGSVRRAWREVPLDELNLN